LPCSVCCSPCRHVGEQNHWAKCTNFDNAVHAPLIFMLPPHLRAVPATFLAVPTEVRKTPFLRYVGYTRKRSVCQDRLGTNIGQAERKGRFLQAVSLFPTLVDLAKLPSLPRCPPPSDPASDKVKLCADGLSLAPLLLHPDAEGLPLSAEHQALANGSLPAYSQWAGADAMGYTMRTARFRYTVRKAPSSNEPFSSTNDRFTKNIGKAEKQGASSAGVGQPHVSAHA
jgi:hypothetical protein